MCPVEQAYNEGGPYHVAFCRHDSDGFAYTPPTPFQKTNDKV